MPCRRLPGAEIDPATSGDDPRLLLLLASREFQAGRPVKDRRSRDCFGQPRPARRGGGGGVSWPTGRSRPRSCLDLVADLALLDHGWPGAAAALQALVDRATHRAALIKLVEICVDGPLTDLMIPTQQRLADA